MPLDAEALLELQDLGPEEISPIRAIFHAGPQ
jgi:hypothetical protein